MSGLNGRVTKLEGIGGRRGPVSEREFIKAIELRRRYFQAIVLPVIDREARAGMIRDGFDEAYLPSVHEPDPAEVALMLIAEKSGQIAAAKDIERRYYRARGIDIDARGKRIREEILRRALELCETNSDERPLL